MAEFPALPLWTDAYLGDTRHLTAAQHGAYLLLIMSAWRTPDCSLPNDDKFLAKLSAMSPKAWANNRDVVMAFWTLDENGRWRQRRLSFVRQKVMVNVNQKKTAGEASALKRKELDQRLLQRLGNGSATNQNYIYKSKKEEDLLSPLVISNTFDIASGVVAKATTPPPPPIEFYFGEKNQAEIPPRAIVKLHPTFDPDEEWGSYAEKMGFVNGAGLIELEKFIGYWTVGKGTGKRKSMRGWRQAWSNWLDISARRK